MNKFLAMLKDSYREAVDGWIFLVMLILAGIVTVLVFSLSFTPLPAEKAIPKMLSGSAVQSIHAGRGMGSKIGLFQSLHAKIKDVSVANPGAKPWEGEFTFTVEYSSQFGFGGGVEVDDAKKPQDVKPIEGGNLFGDTFKEAVRYWTSTPGEKTRPKYSDADALEFVKYQLENITRMKIKSVTQPKAGQPKFTVVAEGIENTIGWAHTPTSFFGLWNMTFLELPLGQQIHLIEDTLINGLGAWVLLLTGVIVTAGFIPNMIRKGAVDLLLTKPLSRFLILLYKYFGGLTFVFLLTALTIGGIWLAIGVRTGIWATGLLFCIFGITFFFAILYACSTFIGVLTRNAIVSIIGTIVFWFVIYLIGTIHNGLTVASNLEIMRDDFRNQMKAPSKTDGKKDDKKEESKDLKTGDDDADAILNAPKIPEALTTTFKVLNAVTPRTKDLDTLTTQLIAKDLLSNSDQKQAGFKLRNLAWGEVLGVASAWIAFFLGLATIRFVTRSY